MFSKKFFLNDQQKTCHYFPCFQLQRASNIKNIYIYIYICELKWKLCQLSVISIFMIVTILNGLVQKLRCLFRIIWILHKKPWKIVSTFHGVETRIPKLQKCCFCHSFRMAKQIWNDDMLFLQKTIWLCCRRCKMASIFRGQQNLILHIHTNISKLNSDALM